MGQPVGEASVEEIWARPAHYQFDYVGKDTVQSQGKAGGEAGLLAVGSVSFPQKLGEEDQGQRSEKGNDKHAAGGEVIRLHVRVPVEPQLLGLDPPLEGRKQLGHQEGHEEQDPHAQLGSQGRRPHPATRAARGSDADVAPVRRGSARRGSAPPSELRGD